MFTTLYLSQEVRVTRSTDSDDCLHMSAWYLVHCKRMETHLILEILADGDTVAQTLPTPRLEYQIPSQRLACSRFQRSELDARIRRISRHSTPMIEAHLTECLT